MSLHFLLKSYDNMIALKNVMTYFNSITWQGLRHLKDFPTKDIVLFTANAIVKWPIMWICFKNCLSVIISSTVFSLCPDEYL